MTVGEKKNFIIHVLYCVLILALIYVGVRYVLVWLLPFVIGFAIAMALKPVIRFVSDKTRWNRRFCAGTIVILAYALIGTLLWLAGSKIVTESSVLFGYLPHFYADTIQPGLMNLNDWLLETLNNLSPDASAQLADFFNSLMSSLSSIIAGISTHAVSGITAFVGSLPLLLIAFLFTIMSSFLISLDYHKIVNFLLRQLPQKGQAIVLEVKAIVCDTVLKYLKAYLILMLITFVELSVGLSILGKKYAITMAALIALADFLPLIGTGAIVIPWIVIAFLTGDISFALGLTILYIIITIIRNIIEPKIVGGQIGLNPLLTLIAMYIGVVLFGFWGLIFMPFLFIIIIKLNESGKIRIFK